MASEIGDLNQARIQAERANKTAPDGVVLVTVAKAPTLAAGVSTISAGSAGAVATLSMWILGRLAPDLSTEELATFGGSITIVLTYVFAWLRHRRQNANSPGVGTPL